MKISLLVMKPDCGDARNSTALAISSGSASRPSGIPLAMALLDLRGQSAAQPGGCL
jgi:hypothetical protein